MRYYNLIYNLNKKKRTLQNLKKNIEETEIQIENGCQNCKRREPYGKYSGMDQYFLTYNRHQVNLLIKRRSFVFLGIDTNDDGTICLCVQWSEYFSNPEDGKLFKNLWTSFFGDFLVTMNLWLSMV